MQDLITEIQDKILQYGIKSEFLNTIDYATIDIDENCLFYILPLIEKTIVEILKFFPTADIEVSTQGRIKTLIPILKDNNFNSFIPNSILENLISIYSDKGIRNKIFHPTFDKYEFEIPKKVINDMKLILMYLLLCYIELININTFNDSYTIELL